MQQLDRVIEGDNWFCSKMNRNRMKLILCTFTNFSHDLWRWFQWCSRLSPLDQKSENFFLNFMKCYRKRCLNVRKNLDERHLLNSVHWHFMVVDLAIFAVIYTFAKRHLLLSVSKNENNLISQSLPQTCPVRKREIFSPECPFMHVEPRTSNINLTLHSLPVTDSDSNFLFFPKQNELSARKRTIEISRFSPQLLISARFFERKNVNCITLGLRNASFSSLSLSSRHLVTLCANRAQDFLSFPKNSKFH